jgi:hypothetical protein
MLFSNHFNISIVCFAVYPCYGPMARDVESLAIAMQALSTPLMSSLDPATPYIPFKKDVRLFDGVKCHFCNKWSTTIILSPFIFRVYRFIRVRSP